MLCWGNCACWESNMPAELYLQPICFSDMFSLYSSGWPQTLPDPSASASLLLRLQVWPTMLNTKICPYALTLSFELVAREASWGCWFLLVSHRALLGVWLPNAREQGLWISAQYSSPVSMLSIHLTKGIISALRDSCQVGVTLFFALIYTVVLKKKQQPIRF